MNIRLLDSEQYGGNRDFVLKYKLAGENIETGLILSDDGKDKFFLLMIQPPKRITNENIPPREYIFVIDVSGSMYGYPLNVSKDVIKKLFSGLNYKDKFNILFFAGSSNMLFESSQFATTENINKAAEMLDLKLGGGGTELLPALKKVYSYPKDDDYSRTILILTDGYITVEREVMEIIRSKLGDANVFAFGIGNGVNRFIIEGIARAGFGEPFIAMNQSESEIIAEKFFHYVNSPIMTDIQVSFDGFDVFGVEPKSVPDVFAERPIILCGKWKDEMKGNIKVSGIYGSERYHVDINVLKFATRVNNQALKYLWARNKISELSDFRMSGIDESTKKEIIDLGLQYNLLTEYTSFVAVDYIARNNGDTVQTVKQMLPLPEGVSDYAISFGSAGGYSLAAPMNRTGVIARGSLDESKKIVLNTDKSEMILNQQPPLVDLAEIQRKIKYDNLGAKLGFEGKVLIKALIGVDGTVKDAEISYSESGFFDSIAVSAVLSTQFVPASIDGKPKEEWVTIPVKFKIMKDSIYKIIRINEGNGSPLDLNNTKKIAFKWKCRGVKLNGEPFVNSGKMSIKVGEKTKIRDIQNWFFDMQKGEKRNIIIPKNKYKEIAEFLSLKVKYKEINFLEIDLE